MNKGCNSDGWDLLEAETKEQFESYAQRRGYDLTRDAEYSLFYAEPATQGAWEMYHKGYVDGRSFNRLSETENKSQKM